MSVTYPMSETPTFSPEIAMSTPAPLPPTEELLHSHSDLTRLIEELETHARALREAPQEETTDLLAEVHNYASQFSSSVREHIVEEEQELFPRCRPYLTVPERVKLERIREQHRDLEDVIDKLFDYLNAARNADVLDSDLAESVYVRARLLRYTFNLHSEEERGFFEQIIQRENGANDDDCGCD